MTRNFPHLSKAPIVEAMLELHTVNTVGLSEESIQSFHDTVGQDYQRKERSIPGVVVKMNGQPEIEDTQTAQGYLLLRQNHVVQVAEHFISLSIMEPYISGDDLLAQFKRVWNSYESIFQPKTVTQCGLRVLNRLTIPTKELPDSVEFTPTITTEEDVPLLFGPLDSRNAVKSTTHSCVGTVDIGLRFPEESSAEVKLDIHCYDKTDMPYASFDTIEPTIQRLRDFKNSVFFANINEKGWERYK